ETAAAALPELAAPKIAGENPWREISQVVAPRAAEAPAIQAERAMSTGDISEGARIHRSIQAITQPAGARIFVGESLQPVCETPCTIQAAPGTYNLRMSLTRYRDETREA